VSGKDFEKNKVVTRIKEFNVVYMNKWSSARIFRRRVLCYFVRPIRRDMHLLSKKSFIANLCTLYRPVSQKQARLIAFSFCFSKY
jgi:hypothetical protein